MSESHELHCQEQPNKNKDKDTSKADVDEDESSEEEEEVRASTLDFLKTRFSGKSQAKSKATPVKPKASAKPGAKAGTKATSKTDLSKNKTGNGAARRSTLESLPEVADVNSQADKDLVDSFTKRLEVLGCLEPPLADGPFKQYLTDRLQELSAYGSEMHLKTKSVGRRLNFAEDPLSVALQKLKDEKAEIQNFVKCNSMPMYFFVFCVMLLLLCIFQKLWFLVYVYF